MILARWRGAVLVCRKCSKKLDGGFGPKGKLRLAKGLRKQVGLKKGRRGSIGIVEVDCFGLCPAGGVTVVDAANPGEWLIVPRGADLAALARQLGLEPAPDGDTVGYGNGSEDVVRTAGLEPALSGTNGF